MKVQPSVMPRCAQCYITRKSSKRSSGALVVRCKKTRKHNQRQGA